MKKHIRLAALGLAVCLLAACTPEAVAPADPSAGEIIDFLTAEGLLGRAVGTPGNMQAGEYVAQRFEAMGLEPFFDEYASPYTQVIYAPEEAGATLEITMADGTVRSLAYGADYTYDVPHGPYDLDLAITADATGHSPGGQALLAGGLQLAEVQGLGFGLLIGRAEGGDDRIALHKKRDAANTGSLTHRITLAADIYDAVAAGGTALRFCAADCKKEIAANNYIALSPGKDRDRAVIITAHFDGAGGQPGRYSQGAVDNASGLAAMLRCAALLKGSQHPVDIVFCAFNGEELGLQGSAAVAPQIEAAYEECIALNIDCVGQAGNTTYSIADQLAQYQGSAVVAQLRRVMDDHGISYGDTPYGSSDHRSFSCPVLAVGATDPVFHTTGDTKDKLDIDEIEAVAAMAADFARGYGGPFDHQMEADSQEEDEYLLAAQQMLAQMGIAPALEYEQCYTFKVQEGVYATISGWRPLTRHEEVGKYYPTVALPAAVGDYSFFSALVHDSRGDATVELPAVHTGTKPRSPDDLTQELPVDQVYSAPLVPSFVNAVYQAPGGERVFLSVSKPGIPGDYSDTSRYLPVEGMPEGGKAYIYLYHDAATGVELRYVAESMEYAVSFTDNSLNYDTVEDFRARDVTPVPVDELVGLYQLFIAPGLDIELK